MFAPPTHLCRIDPPAGMRGMCERFVPTRLVDTSLKYRKQLWYVRPSDWTGLDSYIDAHEAAVNQYAKEGGIGILVYDLSGATMPDNWTSCMVPFAEMHQRLHLNGNYDKWLVKSYIVVKHDILYATLNTVLTGAWKPTRPLQILTSLEELRACLDELWVPRTPRAPRLLPTLQEHGGKKVCPVAVRCVDTLDEFRELKARSETYTVFDFTASWCAPCQKIAPFFEALARELAQKKGVEFCKVDVDANTDVASESRVVKMPTFQVYRGGELVYCTEGASEENLRRIVELVEQRLVGVRTDGDF